jgi:VanZ family protein
MIRTNPAPAQAMSITTLCLFVLAVILTAGLWPFHIERNGVSWLKDEDGLRFDGHGAAVSAGAFRTSRAANATGFSLELYLTPAQTNGRGTFLAFDSSPDPRSPFKLSQFGTSLAVQRYTVDEQGKIHQIWFRVSNIFRAQQRAFVSLSSARDHTDLYLNGVLAENSPDPGIASRELTGRLVVGNSTFDDSWRGKIEGLAIYNQELTAAEVSSHFQSWQRNQSPLSAGESVLAIYRFDELGGNTVRNQIDPIRIDHNQPDPATDLTLPDRYFVLHHTFLRREFFPPGPDAWKRWSSWRDLGVNVGGFLPVGFVFFAYFSTVRRVSHPALLVVLAGFLLSLLIEVSQWFLPNRDSGMADLFTNTTGTALGVLLYRWPPLHAFWTAMLEYLTAGRPDAKNNFLTPPRTITEK